MSNEIDMTTLSIELKQAIQEFLKRESQLNKEIEKYHIALATENESEIARLSLRVDLIEELIKKEVRTNATCFKMAELDFVDLVTQYENKKL